MINNCYLYKIKLLIKIIYRKAYWIILEKPLSAVFYYLPIKENRIVFDNFGGKGFGGNPKYIAEATHQLNNNVEMIWLVDNLAKFDFPKYIHAVKIDSICALYMRATAKIWVDNIRHRHPMRKKDNQVYLQTWHGTMGPKRIEKDAENLLEISYIEEAKYDGKILDAILVDNSLQEQIFLRAFWLNENAEILRFGFPQNDQVERDKKNLKKITELKKNFSMDSSCYYVLYAPTFRDDFSTKGYEINFKGVINAFQNIMKKPTKIIVRLHPNVAFQKEQISFSENILDGTDYPSIQDLALVSDAVISDYSSSLFDFAVLEKPAFVCALDYDEYEKKRGFIKEFYDFPFPIAKSNSELIEIINCFDIKKYKKNLQTFYRKYLIYGDGHASENTAKWILRHIKA